MLFLDFVPITQLTTGGRDLENFSKLKCFYLFLYCFFVVNKKVVPSITKWPQILYKNSEGAKIHQSPEG